MRWFISVAVLKYRWYGLSTCAIKNASHAVFSDSFFTYACTFHLQKRVLIYSPTRVPRISHRNGWAYSIFQSLIAFIHRSFSIDLIMEWKQYANGEWEWTVDSNCFSGANSDCWYEGGYRQEMVAGRITWGANTCQAHRLSLHRGLLKDERSYPRGYDCPHFQSNHSSLSYKARASTPFTLDMIGVATQKNGRNCKINANG